jgi:hypothetical protein
MRPDAPLVGWRVWRLKDGRLHSWVVDHVWGAGRVAARCLPTRTGMLGMDWSREACSRSPGEGCKCGFWALTDIERCVSRARSDPSRTRRRSAVIGLMAGWGTVAIHGDEGFRCQYASVLCLLSDGVDDDSLAPRGPGAGWWGRLTDRWPAGWRPSERAARRRRESLQRAAAYHGVPLVSLADAIRCGVLAEFGMPAPGPEATEALSS